MARSYKYKKKTARRRPKVAYRNRGSNPTGKVTSNVNQSLSRSVGMPQCFNVKLRYTDHRVISVSQPYYQYVYRLNSLSDPDQTGTGHEPMYYDSLKTIYNEYLVTGCKVSISITQDNTTDSPATVFWGVKDTVSLSPIPSISNCMEQGDRTIMQLGFAAAGSATKTLTQYTNIARVHGIAGKLTPKNIPFTATISSNPAEQVFGILQIFSSDNLTRVNCILTVTLDYTACFFNRRQVEQN